MLSGTEHVSHRRNHVVSWLAIIVLQPAKGMKKTLRRSEGHHLVASGHTSPESANLMESFITTADLREGARLATGKVALHHRGNRVNASSTILMFLET
jgi:hypothetical protein